MHLHYVYYVMMGKLKPKIHPLTVPTFPREVSVTRVFQDGVELNWLPPTEPNGEVLHYVIYYTPEGGTEQNSSIGSNLTHYNLTGLERNRVYTNIAVQSNDTGSNLTHYNLTGLEWNRVYLRCMSGLHESSQFTFVNHGDITDR